MKNVRFWAFFFMIAGTAIAILSALFDVWGGPDAWHFGTAVGAGLFTYGIMTEIFRRRGYHSKRR